MRRILLFLTPLLSALAYVRDIQGQCPVVYNCPQGSPVLCDFSTNDTLLWNGAPYTWSKALETADLYEGIAEFSIKILPCAGGGNVNISYTLLLDLDNDNLRETALSSNAFPPAGIIYADNAFNPGYTGGEPVEFDKRAVPDSLKFRFALEISNSWDTLIARLCWQTGSLFVSPRLPEGRHHLVWRVEQDGVVKYCEHSFRIKDCAEPTLECAPDGSVSLDSGGMATLHWQDILIEAEDNVTPLPQLEFSMRKSGSGAGFPLDSLDKAVETLSFDCEEVGVRPVELWVRDRLGNTEFCETSVLVADDGDACTEPPLICASPFWYATDTMKLVAFKVVWVDTAQQLMTHALPLLPDGCALMTFLPPASSFSLIAECDTNPLNGVSTFDLLLISRHILGIQPFDAPWKRIAADANKNGSITTFDLVELRKLILGIYNKLPANTSWRFFPADCDYPDSLFTAYCAPEYSFATMPLWSYPPALAFNGVKIGDVNGTANPQTYTPPTTETRGEPVLLYLPDLAFQAGGTYDIPIRAGEAAGWLGFQFGLQFDPDVIETETIGRGDLPGFDENAFAQPQPGRLNVSWFRPAPEVIFPDADLITLRVKALQTARLSDAVHFSKDGLKAEVYAADETIRPLQLRFGKMAPPTGETAVFQPQPNPTNSGVNIPVRLAQPETARLEVADISGKIIFQSENMLESGVHLLEVPASAFPSAGIYVWHIQMGAFFQAGRVARQ